MLSALMALALAAPQEADRDGFEAQLHLIPRFSDLSGSIDDGLDLGYEDLWSGGIGFTVEADFLGSAGRNWKVGGYIAAGFDVYEGDRAVDPFGDSLEADTMTTSHFMAGFKAVLAPDGGFYFDVRVGLGPVFYAETEGTLTIGGFSGVVTIFDATPTLGGEIAVHFGYSSRHVIIAGGLSGRTQGAPDASDLAFDDLGNAFNGSIEIEVAFRF